MTTRGEYQPNHRTGRRIQRNTSLSARVGRVASGNKFSLYVAFPGARRAPPGLPALRGFHWRRRGHDDAQRIPRAAEEQEHSELPL